MNVLKTSKPTLIKQCATAKMANFFPPIQRNWNDPWVWSVPIFALTAMLIVYLGGWNQSIFLFFNGFSQFTGDGLWSHLTLLGDTLIPFCLAILWSKSRSDVVWAMILAAIVATLFVHGIKPLADLPRPAAVLPPESLHIIGKVLRRNSFPSGHTVTIFTFVGVIVLQSRANLLNSLFILLACLVGISRCAVGAHWTLDILAGMAGGWTAAWLGILGARRWTWGQTHPHWLATIFSLCIMILWIYSLNYPHTFIFQKFLAMLCTVAAIHFWLSVKFKNVEIGLTPIPR